MLFDYAVITGNGLTEEGCYGVMEDDVALLEALTRADNANCHDWCDSNRVGMCGGRDFADVYSLISSPSFEDAGYSEPVVTPEESSSDDEWVYPEDPLEPLLPLEPDEPEDPLEPLEPLDPLLPLEPLEPLEPLDPLEPLVADVPLLPLEPG